MKQNLVLAPDAKRARLPDPVLAFDPNQLLDACSEV